MSKSLPAAWTTPRKGTPRPIDSVKEDLWRFEAERRETQRVPVTNVTEDSGIVRQFESSILKETWLNEVEHFSWIVGVEPWA